MIRKRNRGLRLSLAILTSNLLKNALDMSFHFGKLKKKSMNKFGQD